MNFSEYDIVFQEIPNEISLAFTMTGCQLACKGCHSSFLWNPKNGEPLTDELLISLITRYSGLITTVLFLGGEWDQKRLIELLEICEKHSLKTALYTGLDKISTDLQSHLTFLKVGPWIPELGGLDSPTTNQKMFRIIDNTIMNKLFL